MGSPYQSQSAASYNSSPPPDDGTTVAANKITWAVTKTKLADPLKSLADSINTQLLTALDVSHNTTSVGYTTLVSDHVKPIEVTGTTTISLGDASTMTAGTLGYRVYVVNKGVATVTVNLANAANTLDGTVNGTQSIYPGGVGIFSVNQARNGYYSLAGMKGNTWAVPGAIGATTPNTGAFTTLAVSGAAQALNVTNSQNADTGITVTNTNAGVSATCRIDLLTNVSGALTLFALGESYAGSAIGGITNAKLKVILDNSSAAHTSGLLIGGSAATPLYLMTNNTVRVTIDSAGAITNAGSLTNTGLITANGGATVASGQTLTLTGATTLGGIAQNSQSAAYTTVLADGGKHILHPTADNVARTFTIDSNANVAYPIGTTLTFVNEINTVTIAITTDTLLLAGTASTGSRTLAAGGIATALKKGTTSWIISGTGLS